LSLLWEVEGFANGVRQQKEQMRSNVPREKIRFCFPPMHGIGAMHSKLMLLKYEGYMRIVVPTGNLMSFDWGETGTMENVGSLMLRCYRVLTVCRWCSSSTSPSS
jgi:hypothetical protein